MTENNGLSNKAKSWHKRKSVAQVLEDQCGDIDPIEEMVKLAQHEDTTWRLKYDIWRTISEYLYPKRKAIQHSGDDKQPINFNFMLDNED